MLDGPRQVEIRRSTLAAFKDGDWLRCSAEGNPPPTYHWTVADTGRFIHQGLMTLDCATVS